MKTPTVYKITVINKGSIESQAKRLRQFILEEEAKRQCGSLTTKDVRSSFAPIRGA